MSKVWIDKRGRECFVVPECKERSVQIDSYPLCLESFSWWIGIHYEEIPNPCGASREVHLIASTRDKDKGVAELKLEKYAMKRGWKRKVE